MSGTRVAHKLLQDTYREWRVDRAPQLSAALTYYVFLSTAPLLVLLVGVAGRFLGRSAVSERLYQQTFVLAGPAGEQLVRDLVATARPGALGTVATFVALGIALAGSMQLFRQLRFAFDIMWKIPPDEAPGGDLWEQVKWSLSAFGTENLAAFLMVLAVGGLLVISLVLSSAISLAAGGMAPILQIATPTLRAFETVLSMVLVTVLFAIVYRYLPRTSIAWKDVWVGAIITAMLFMLGRLLLGTYFAYATPGSAYGAAGSVVALLIWVNFSLQVVLFGAEFAYVWTYARGSKAADADRS